MEDLKYYYQIVEKAIAKIGLNPDRTRTEMGKWSLRNKDIPIWVDVYYQESEKKAYFMVAAPIMEVTAENKAQVGWELLEMNTNLYGVAFVAKNNKVFLKTIREAEGLDISEANAMILRIGNYAIQHAPTLKEKYPVPVTHANRKSD